MKEGRKYINKTVVNTKKNLKQNPLNSLTKKFCKKSFIYFVIFVLILFWFVLFCKAIVNIKKNLKQNSSEEKNFYFI